MAVTLGAKAFTKVVAKSESAYGTPSSFNDANGELLHTDIVGVIDPGVTVDLADDKSAGIRPRRLAASATVTAKAPVITLADAPVSARNLPIYFDALATITPTGSGPYSWIYTPSATDVDTIKTYSLYLTDGVQKYIVDGCVPSEMTLSADQSGLLQAGVTWSARNIATTTDVSTAAFAQQYFVPGRLFGVRTNSSFITTVGGGNAYSTYATNWSLTLMPGAAPLQVLNGSSTNVNAGGVAYTGALDGTLELTIASNSSKASAFPLADIGTTKYVQVSGVDSAGYGFTASIVGVMENVSVIGSESDGLILETVTIQLASDGTNSVKCWISSPLAARPASA
jgi:hypothetical protein